MNRKQLEKMAREMDLQLDSATGMEYASAYSFNQSRVRWIVRTPGYAEGKGFSTLSEVDDYLSSRCRD